MSLCFKCHCNKRQELALVPEGTNYLILCTMNKYIGIHQGLPVFSMGDPNLYFLYTYLIVGTLISRV